MKDNKKYHLKEASIISGFLRYGSLVTTFWGKTKFVYRVTGHQDGYPILQLMAVERTKIEVKQWKLLQEESDHARAFKQKQGHKSKSLTERLRDHRAQVQESISRQRALQSESKPVDTQALPCGLAAGQSCELSQEQKYSRCPWLECEQFHPGTI